MILVTGANGLLGSFILRKLVAEGESVIGLKRRTSDTHLTDDLKGKIAWRDADVTDTISLNESFKDASCVIHAAAMVSFNPREEDQLYKVNVDGTKNVVNACLTNGIKKLIHISSVAALGRQKGSSILDENSKWIDSPLNSAYAKSKYLAELEVYRGIEEGLPANIVNPSFILAPSDWEKSSSQMFHYIWKEKKFYSSGQANYVDVEDVAEIVFKLCRQNFVGERFIASAGTISFKELFEQMALRLKKKAPSIKVGSKLLTAFALTEEIRCRVFGTRPLITRESVKATKEIFTYSNKKSVEHLTMKYKTLSETLDRCCDYYQRTYNTKK
ncbi:MAG: NAD-dependent epimerase/dehydratase family protein [Cyclobacteriaceae bacterium]